MRLDMNRQIPVAAAMGPRKPCAILIAGIALTTGAVPALAQGQADGVQPHSARAGALELEEVIVLARKREESLQDVPVAMQAFDKEALDRYATASLQQVAEMSNQVLLFPVGAGSGAAMSVRGIASTTADAGVDQSVVVNVDGLQSTRGRIMRQALFDVASVEVLKGPQVLYFGKNSPAGVVSVRTNGPGEEREFIGRAYYEFEAAEFIGDLVASGPITEKLGARLAYRGGVAEGWLDNEAQPHPAVFPLDPFPYPGALDESPGGYEEHLLRLTLQYDPTEELAATLKVTGTQAEYDSSGSLKEVISCSRDKPVTLGVVDPFGDCKLNGKVSAGAIQEEIREKYQGIEGLSNGSGHNEYDNIMAVLDIAYEAGPVTINSVTGYFDYDWERWDNFDGTVFNVLGGFEDETYEQWSQEVRLLTEFDSPFNFLLGVFYEHSERETLARNRIAPLGFDPVTGRSNSAAVFGTAEADSYAAFGQVIWDIGERFELTVGGRLGKEEKDGELGTTYVHAFLAGLFRPVGDVVKPEFSDTSFSPEVTATWKVTEEVTVYAAYKTGYKSGGFSTSAIVTRADTKDSVLYESEEASGGEVGLKYRVLEGRLQGSVTAYHYLYDDIQDSIFNSATVSFEIRNADAEATGFDVEANYLITNNLSLRAQAAYNESTYRTYSNAPCWAGQTAAEGCAQQLDPSGVPFGPSVQNLSGEDRFLAPEWTGSAGFTYQTVVVDGLDFSISGDVIFTDGYETVASNNPFSYQESVTRYNASVRLGRTDSWEVALMGRNLTNERYVSISTDKPGGVRGDVIADVARPRHVALQLTYRL